MEKEGKPTLMKLPPKFNATTSILDANVTREAGDRIALYYQEMFFVTTLQKQLLKTILEHH